MLKSSTSKIKLKHTTLYEGNEDLKNNGFICEKLWFANDNIDENK